jgi:hypothetical protein
VFWQELSPYRTTTDVTDFQVSVWAKFLNPQVAGPIIAAGLPKHQSDVQTQNLTTRRRFVDPEQLIKSTSHVLESAVNSSPIAPIIKTVSKGIDFVESAAADVGAFFGLFDKPTSIAATAPMLPQYSRGFTTTSGVNPSVRLGQHPSSRLATTGVFPTDTSLMTLTKLAQVPMLHHIDYFDGATRVSFDLVCAPLDSLSTRTQNVTRDYFEYIARAHMYWRGSIRYRVKFICGAMIKARVQIAIKFNGISDTSGQIFTRVLEINGDTETFISVPYLHNAYWSPPQASGFSVADQFPSLQFTLIDQITGAQGSSDPFVDVLIWRAAGADVQFARPVTAPVTLPTPPTLKIKKTKSIFPPKSTKVPEHQTSLRAAFEKPFESLVCDCTQAMERGYCTDDTSTTVADLMKRFVGNAGTFAGIQLYSPSLIAGGFYYDWDGIDYSGAMGETYFYYRNLFWFERGDRHVKLLFRPNATGEVHAFLASPLSGEAGTSNGYAFQLLNSNPQLEVEVPWTCPYPYMPLYQDCDSQIMTQGKDYYIPVLKIGTSTTGDTIVQYQSFIAASDNYVCGMLAPPPFVDGDLASPSKKKVLVH